MTATATRLATVVRDMIDSLENDAVPRFGRPRALSRGRAGTMPAKHGGFREKPADRTVGCPWGISDRPVSWAGASSRGAPSHTPAPSPPPLRGIRGAPARPG